MEAFYKTHSHLLELLGNPVRRTLMDEVDWDERVICIKGCRGVGKTTFLLHYAKEFFGRSKKCLYVNLDNFYFCHNRLTDFADAFVAQGGTVLLIDGAGKYPGWTRDVKACCEKHPALRIVCAVSPVFDADEDCHEINDIAKLYTLGGLTFREYLNLVTAAKHTVCSLDTLLADHDKVIADVTRRIEPLDFFQNYLHHGYFPFLMEKKSHSATLLKAVNMMIEVDILLARQIEMKYLAKIRALLYKLASADSAAPVNISHLSDEVQASRATVMNYLKYMDDAGLIMMLYSEYDEYPKKPSQIMIGNPNIQYAICHGSRQNVANEIFAVNALSSKHLINKDKRAAGYIIDNTWLLTFDKAGGNAKSTHCDAVFTHRANGESVRMPLWLLGFID